MRFSLKLSLLVTCLSMHSLCASDVTGFSDSGEGDCQSSSMFEAVDRAMDEERAAYNDKIAQLSGENDRLRAENRQLRDLPNLHASASTPERAVAYRPPYFQTPAAGPGLSTPGLNRAFYSASGTLDGSMMCADIPVDQLDALDESSRSIDVAVDSSDAVRQLIQVRQLILHSKVLAQSADNSSSSKAYLDAQSLNTVHQLLAKLLEITSLVDEVTGFSDDEDESTGFEGQEQGASGTNVTQSASRCAVNDEATGFSDDEDTGF